jgi:hypothetical protein
MPEYLHGLDDEHEWGITKNWCKSQGGIIKQKYGSCDGMFEIEFSS